MTIGPDMASAAPTLVDPRSAATLSRQLQAAATRWPDKVALIAGDETITFADLEHRSRALAQRLVKEGVRPGDRVGVHWGNSIECVLLMLGCFQAGVIALPVNTRFKAAEIAYIMQHAGAAAWFSQPELAETAETAAAHLGRPLAVRSALPANRTVGDLPACAPDSPAVIMYTSGTTARPKGVVHTHASLLAQARIMPALGVGADDVVLGITSLMHISGMICTLLGSIQAGAAMVLAPVFDPAGVLDLIEKHRCTWTLALPAMLQFILDEQERTPREVSCLRVVLSGGDSVPSQLRERCQRLFPQADIREVYGLTEIAPVGGGTADVRPGSLGRPADGVAMRVLDAAGGELGDGQIGEIAIRSDANFSGYWNDEEATQAAIRDGWFLTGDLGHRDADGFYWFEGRKKEVIIRGGSNVSPQEVEEALYQHPAVREAGVVGMPHPILGEEVVACVALRDGHRLTAEALREFTRQYLADFKTPAQIVFLDVLPKGITGKIQRRALKEMLSAACPEPARGQRRMARR
jgi:long-chain acyl-CoA synthetase